MTGSLQEKNGKYYAVINLTDIYGKRKQKWISTGYEIRGNKKKAEKFLRDKLNEYEAQEGIITTDILFSDYILYWLENEKTKVDKVTYQGYCNVVNAHILPYFKEMKIPLTDVKREMIQQYINVKHQNGKIRGGGGLSPKSLKLHFVIIRQIFNEAVKNNLILSNPCNFVNLPRIEHYEADFYTVGELSNMFSLLKDEPLYPLIYLTSVLGLRRSEILGLKWDSVNLEANLITIKHTVVRFTEVVEKDRTKNNASYRSYPMTEEIKQMLIDLKEQEAVNRDLFGSEYIDNDYIFKWENGKPYAPDYITRKFKKLLKQYGLRPIRFHDLRHSCASLLIANGFQLKDISEWLGHADIQTTADIYGHLDVERKNKIAQSMSNSLKF